MAHRELTEDEEDHKATLCHDLEKELRELVEQITRKKQSMAAIGHYARGVLAIEHRYKEAGLSWGDITAVRKGIVNGTKV